MLPHSEACERNKQPILDVLSELVGDAKTLLEVGSGTGQHAVYLSRHLSPLIWQPSDTDGYLPGLRARVAAEGGANLLAPLDLNVSQNQWPDARYDVVFSANTLHIMSWQAVNDFFEGMKQAVSNSGLLVVYGPFKYRGDFTSVSNREFDQSLRMRDAAMGIRDFEEVNELAEMSGLELQADHKMPANNQCLVWRKDVASA